MTGEEHDPIAHLDWDRCHTCWHLLTVCGCHPPTSIGGVGVVVNGVDLSPWVINVQLRQSYE